jgi:integrase
MASIERRDTSRGVRYDVRYRDPTGRARTKTLRRRSDADRYDRTVEVDKDRGLFVDPKLARSPLADVARAWLESNPGKRGGSRDRDEQVVSGHIVPALGDRPVGSLTPADVQGVVNRWASARAPRTVRREYAVLRAILNYAVRLDMVGRTPCRGINLPEVKPLRRHIVSAVEVARLAEALGGVGQLGPMVYVAVVEGMRWGEIAGLRVGHLDFAANTLTVRETVVRGRRGTIGFGEPKSAAGRRTLAAPGGLMAMLRDHVAEKGLAVSDEKALLFTAPGGSFLRYSNWVRRSWYPAAVGRERYEGLSFHDLRRANATGLVAEGVDVKTAQTMLGHSEARLTLDVYAQAVAKLGEAAAEAMGARFLVPSARDGRAMPSVSEGRPG